jgi:hypothetical protein
MGAAIPQDEQARLGAPRSAGPVAGWPASARPGHAGRPQEPVDGRPADGDPGLLLELLRQVRGVQARIPALGQGEDLLLQGRGEAAA